LSDPAGCDRAPASGSFHRSREQRNALASPSSATLSLSLAANYGPLDSLNRRVRCGCRPCLRQMRCTELTLMPWSLANGGGRPVRRLSRRINLGRGDGVRRNIGFERRNVRRPCPVAQQPSDTVAYEGSCQRQTAVLLTVACRLISVVPYPFAVNSTICAARHASACCFGPPRSHPLGHDPWHSRRL
jgi:hypothetical protein